MQRVDVREERPGSRRTATTLPPQSGASVAVMKAYGCSLRGAGLARAALTLLSLAALIAALPIAWRLHETHALRAG